MYTFKIKDFRDLKVTLKLTDYFAWHYRQLDWKIVLKGTYVVFFRPSHNSSTPARFVNNFLPTSQISPENKSRCSKHRIKELVYKISFPVLRFLFSHRISFHKWAIIENETVLRGGWSARHSIKALKIDWTYKIFSRNSQEPPPREALCIFLLCYLTFYSISARVRPL